MDQARIDSAHLGSPTENDMAKKLLFKSAPPLPAQVRRLFVTLGDETAARLAPVRRVDSPADFVEGLGVDPETAQRVAAITTPQELHAALRGAALTPDTRHELMTRALIYFKRQRETQEPPPLKRFLKKGTALGGAYYKRVPTGNPKRPWRYYYTRAAYERAHAKTAHRGGEEEKRHRAAAKKKAGLPRPP